MMGILIATHGKLAEGLLDAVKLITGPQENVLTLGLEHEDSIEEFTDNVKMAIEQLGRDGEVLVFTDLIGASPYNATVKCVNTIKDVKFRVVTGTNLGMLIEVFLKRSADPDIGVEELAQIALTKGKENITELFDQLARMQRN